jgi:Chaperone of endosialidase
VTSSRFKDDIKPMDKASEAILSLEPVAFRTRRSLIRRAHRSWALCRRREKINPDLVVRDKEGKPYSVRYDR